MLEGKRKKEKGKRKAAGEPISLVS